MVEIATRLLDISDPIEGPVFFPELKAMLDRMWESLSNQATVAAEASSPVSFVASCSPPLLELVPLRTVVQIVLPFDAGPAPKLIVDDHPEYTIVYHDGSTIPEEGLQSGRPLSVIFTGTTWRLTYPTSAAEIADPGPQADPNVAIFENRALAATAADDGDIGPDVDTVVTLGRVYGGDNGGGTYRFSLSDPGEEDQFPASGGGYWYLTETDPIVGESDFTYGRRDWSATGTGLLPQPLTIGTLVDVAGVGRVLEIEGEERIYSRKLFRVDTTRIYRVTGEVRQTVDPDVAGESEYLLGVHCLDADFQTLGGATRYCGALNEEIVVADGWREFSGTITGTHASDQKAFVVGTVYGRIEARVNRASGSGTAQLRRVRFEDVTAEYGQETKFGGGFPALLNSRGHVFSLTDYMDRLAVPGTEASDTAGLERWIASGEKGLNLNLAQFNLSGGTYVLPAGAKLRGEHRSGSILKCVDPSQDVVFLDPAAGNCSLKRLRLLGPQDTVSTYVDGQIAVGNPNDGEDCDGFEMDEVDLIGWAHGGVLLHRGQHPRVTRCWIEHVGRHGIMMAGGYGERVWGNVIKNVAPGAFGTAPIINRYGISFTSDGFGAGFPVNQDMMCAWNYIEGVATWKGIDVHAMRGGKICFNTIVDTMIAIAVAPSSGDNNDPAEDVLVQGNRCRTTTTYRRAGILITGVDSSRPTEDIQILDNTLDGYGCNQATFDLAGSGTDEGAIHARYALGTIVRGNTIRNWNKIAINLRGDVTGGCVEGNDIGNGNTVDSTQIAIAVREANTVSAAVRPNTIRRTSGSMVGLSVGGSAPSDPWGPRVGKQHMIGVPTPLAAGSFVLMHPESEYVVYGSVNNFDLASIAGKTSTGPFNAVDMNVTVSGARVGDRVVAIIPSAATGLVPLGGAVIANDTVSIYWTNPSGSAIDAPNTLDVTVGVAKRGVV